MFNCNTISWGIFFAIVLGDAHTLIPDQPKSPSHGGVFKTLSDLEPHEGSTTTKTCCVCARIQNNCKEDSRVAWRTYKRSDIHSHTFLFSVSAIVGEGGNVGWECVDPCGGIKVLDGGEGGCVYASHSTVWCAINYQSLLLWSIPGLMAIARQRVCVRACVRLCVQDLSPYTHDWRYFIHCLWACQRNFLCHDVSSCHVLYV